MNYPSFYNDIPTITLQDPLSEFLGAFDEGIIEFSYIDCVKSAGHSCPTVLGAYLMTLHGLKALYQNELPQRGDIKVEFSQDEKEGVAGVIANVIQNITGATSATGFKGIAGHFDRRNLMFFNANITSSVRFTRRDNNSYVDVTYDPRVISSHSSISDLRQKILTKNATLEEKQEFAQHWQQWVHDIAKCDNQVIKITYS